MSLLHNAATKIQGETHATTTTGVDEHAIAPSGPAPTFQGELGGLEEIFGVGGPILSAFHAASTALATGTGIPGVHGGTRESHSLSSIAPALHSALEGATQRATEQVSAPNRLSRVTSSIRGDLQSLVARVRG
jgi:hypothetical protein